MSNNDTTVEEMCKSCKYSYYPWCVVHSCRDCPQNDGVGCRCYAAIQSGNCSNYVKKEREDNESGT